MPNFITGAQWFIEWIIVESYEIVCKVLSINCFSRWDCSLFICSAYAYLCPFGWMKWAEKISFIHNNCGEKINTLWIIADCQPWKIRMKLRTAKPQYSGLKWHFFCVKIDSNKLSSTLKWNKISGSCCFIKIKTNKFQTTHHNRRRLNCHWYRLPYCNCFCFNVILLVAVFLRFSFTKINSKEIHKTN